MNRDLAHEADMRRRARQQLSLEEAELHERNAEGTYAYDEPSDYELDCYYAEQDAQVAAYRS